MLVPFCDFPPANALPTGKITTLTFNGRRKLILEGLSKLPSLVALFDFSVANRLSLGKIIVLSLDGQRKLGLNGLFKVPNLVSCVTPSVLTVDRSNNSKMICHKRCIKCSN
jgi:hypothetical protein